MVFIEGNIPYAQAVIGSRNHDTLVSIEGHSTTCTATEHTGGVEVNGTLRIDMDESGDSLRVGSTVLANPPSAKGVGDDYRVTILLEERSTE